MRAHKTDSAYSHTSGYYFFYSERMQGKISKQKRCMEGSIEKTRHEFQNSLPVESHRRSLIAPGVSCVNTCEMLSTREAH